MVRRIFLSAFISALVSVSAFAQPVPAGDDYLSTVPGDRLGGGTYFDFSSVTGGEIDTVQFQGNPLGTSPVTGQVYDTIIQREQAAIVNGPAEGGPMTDTIPAQLTALSLESVGPVSVDGSFFDIFVTLDPSVPSTGTITINHEYEDFGGPPGYSYLSPTVPLNASGTFESSFDVFIDMELVPVGGGSPTEMGPIGPLDLSSSGYGYEGGPDYWTYGPDGEFLILWPDLAVPSPGLIKEGKSWGVHEAQQVDDVTVPEPVSMIFFGTGLVGLVGYVARRRKR